MNGFDIFGNIIASLALTVPRVAAAFLVLPLLTEEDMPSMVRNSFFVSLAILLYPLLNESQPLETLQPVQWFWLVVKEAFIGVCIGFMFGIVFWAIGQVGGIIDTKVGSTQATLNDPLTGHQDSLTAVFLSRFASWLFMATGGFLIFIELLVNSYVVWPVISPFPQLSHVGEMHFVGAFDKMMVLTLVLVAPALVILGLIDLGLGLMNRYAQQLNVLALSMSIKSWVATWIVLISLLAYVEVVLRTLSDNRGLLNLLKYALPIGNVGNAGGVN